MSNVFSGTSLGDDWDGIGRDPSLPTPFELALEARERAKKGGDPYFNNYKGPTLEELYARINTAYGGDTAGQVVTSAMESDYLNALGETYSEQLAREALERSKQYENEMLARNNAATQAAEAAQTTEPTTKQIDTQDKDDEFQVKVNAAGGVNPGTLGEVIKVAEEVYGDGSSRAIVSVLAESIKAGITGKDLSEATGLSEEEIFEAGKNAANDSNKELSASEVINGGLNTVYDVVNSAIDLVEAGVDLTGLDKVVDALGNTVSRIGGLIPSQVRKVLVVNPVTGQVTVQASSQPQGGIIGSLPQSPYVPIGTTSGGTTYGVDAENALLNVVLGKIRTQGGLDTTDVTSVISAAVEDILGIPMETTATVISGAADIATDIADIFNEVTSGEATSSLDDSSTSTTITTGSGNFQDNETGFDVVNGGASNDTVTGGASNDTVTGGASNDTVTGGAGNDTVTGGASNDTVTGGASNDTVTGGASNDTVTGGASNDTVTGGASNDTVTGGASNDTVTGGASNDTVTGGAGNDTVTGGAGNDTVTGGAGNDTVTGGAGNDTITAATPCDTAGEVRNPVTLVCGKPTGGGGTDKIICPDTYNNAKAQVDSLDECGGLKSTSTVVDEDDDKTVVVDGVTNVVNYVCKEEGAVYNPVTDRCEKTTTTTIAGVTDLTQVSCLEPGAQYDATMNNGQGGCYIDNSRVIEGAETRGEVSCLAEGAVYDATMNDGQGGCYIDNSRVIEGAETRGEVSCLAEGAVYDATMNDGQGGCYIDNSRVITETIDRTNLTTEYVCEEGVLDTTTNRCVNTVTGNVINKTVCDDGSAPDADGNCLVTVTGNVINKTVCEEGVLDTTTNRCVNTVTGNVINKTVCDDGSAPDADGNCLVTITGDVIEKFTCPEGSYEDNGVCYSDVTGEVVEKTVCPAGQTLNQVTGLCEYTKVLCGAGFTLNLFTGQCEPDEEREESEDTGTTVTPPSLNLSGRGDFVGKDDVLVENPGDLGGIYSILPAPVRESFLADRRQQDIRNVADVVGIRPGAGLDQDPGAVKRFSRYANAFDIGFPEISNISGILPSDAPLYEETFGVEFRDPGTAPPVRPTEDISKERYTPDLSLFARGGVVEDENGIESLLNNRQRAVNRMLIKRAGSYFE